MKTKTKILALVEIAIVLCSVFLVALPALGIAAEEDDYVLGIYGNANEDNTIDMRDLTYVKLIFFGKKPETELADAKYDGKINPLDFIQIKLIIVGKEKELTIIDEADRTVTVKKPIVRAIAGFPGLIEIMRSIKAADKIVGIDTHVLKRKIFFQEFIEYPTIGSHHSPDIEKILALRPDIVLLTTGKKTEELQNTLMSADPNIAVVCFNSYTLNSFGDVVRKLGYIFDKEDEAKEFLDFYYGNMDTITEQVEKLSEVDKPKVYLESFFGSYGTIGVETGSHEMIVVAGGNNIFGDLSGYPKIDPEEVVNRNPVIILKTVSTSKIADDVYCLDVGDIAKLKAIREEIMNRLELQNVAAVEKGGVYVFTTNIWCSPRYLIGIAYYARWFHPELFEDLDPKAIHQEYLTRFQGLDIDLDKKGVFVYHPGGH